MPCRLPQRNLLSLALLSVCLHIAAPAQEAPIIPASFEIVSIRPAKDPGPPHFGPTPNGYQASNLSLLVSVLMAYLPLNGQSYYTSDRIKGAPDWAQSDRYDIQARVAEADLPRWHNPEQQKLMIRDMLQSFLADRCKLAVHRETKDSPIFQLVAGKSGPHLTPSDPAAPHPSGVSLPAGGTLVPGANGTSLSFYAAPMAALAQVLSNFAGRPVQDKTGLTGTYDFTLEREAADPASQTSPASPSPPGPPTYAIAPLGLRLEPSHSIVDTLVIDHLERPTEN